MENEAGSAAAGPRYRVRLFMVVLGVAAIVLLWQALSMLVSPIFVASPSATLAALGQLAADGSLWRELGYSLERLLAGLGAGAVCGIALGILAGINLRARSFLDPLRWTAMTVPAVIISVLAMLWFGLGSAQSIFMVAVITLPVTYVSTAEGMAAIDSRIMEMAQVYQVPAGLRLKQIYLPGIGSAVMTGLTLAAGIGVRSLILAEFLGAREGIGHAMFLSWTFLDTPSLFAWIVMAFVLLTVLEFGLLQPVRNRLGRWKRTA